MKKNQIRTFKLKRGKELVCAVNELKKKLIDSGYIGVNGKVTFELSELIEACGDDLSHIKQIVHAPAEGRWWAVSHSKFDGNGNNLEECGSTPEEAVAGLWLKLNQK